MGKKVKKVRITWRDTQNPEITIQDEHEIGDMKETGHTIPTKWEIVEITVEKDDDDE